MPVMMTEEKACERREEVTSPEAMAKTEKSGERFVGRRSQVRFRGFFGKDGKLYPTKEAAAKAK